MSTRSQAADPPAAESAESEVLALMAQQHGLVSRAQALAAGMTIGQVYWRVRTGRWMRTAPSVYRSAAVPPTPRSRLLAACIAYEALASHRSAAALLGIDGYWLDKAEIVVATGRVSRVPGVRLHHSSQMGLARLVVRDGIPCTDPARTVLDLAGVVSRKRLDGTIDAVLRDGLLRLRDLWAVLALHARPGRNGTAALRTALEARAVEGGVPLSDWSRMVADLLEGYGLRRPCFEHRVEDASGALVAQVDLAYPAERLAIELDSVKWHFNLKSFMEDPRRRNATTLAGWTVLAFTWDDYAKRPDALCAAVDAALSRRAG